MLAAVVSALAVFVCAPLEASPPPVDFALEAVGEGSERRADHSWSMTRVDDGLEQMCGESTGSDESGTLFRFAGDGSDIRVGPNAAAPWHLLWAVLWAEEPAGVLGGLADWTDETARVEVAEDAPVNCWGRDSRMCVDEQHRRVEVLEVEMGSTRWGIYMLRDGTRVQISRDGAHFARLVRGGC